MPWSEGGRPGRFSTKGRNFEIVGRQRCRPGLRERGTVPRFVKAGLEMLMPAGLAPKHVRLLRCTGRTRSHSGFNPTMATKRAQTLLFRFPTEALP